MEYTKSNELFRRAMASIPLGAQTYSKSYIQYVSGMSPLFLSRGDGCRVWDVDGNEYVDMVNGLLAVVLGYNYNPVSDAVIGQLERGVSFSLATELEVQLAEKLIELIPCAEMVRFGKNGSDATAGAVRLARAYTKRDHIACCGYHGWQDWYIGTTSKNAGVPDSYAALSHPFNYNDVASLEKVLADHPGQVAAVIMEPMSIVEPEPGFLQQVRELATQHGAVLIFDEIITGFRFDLRGAQNLFGVTPDLTTLGKSMANGFAVSAIVGRKEIMRLLEEVFFSFTFGGETVSLAAALKTIEVIEQDGVIPHLWELGEHLQKNCLELLAEAGLAEVVGLFGKPCWTVLTFADQHDTTGLEIKSLFQQEVIKRGFLTIGSHNMSFSHTRNDLDRLLGVYREVFAIVSDALKKGTVRDRLEGKPIQPVFRPR